MILLTDDGQRINAELTTEHSASSYGQPVLVLENGEVLGTLEAVFSQPVVVEATAEEWAGLAAAGYELPAIDAE